jgi:hypothetical protein
MLLPEPHLGQIIQHRVPLRDFLNSLGLFRRPVLPVPIVIASFLVFCSADHSDVGKYPTVNFGTQSPHSRHNDSRVRDRCTLRGKEGLLRLRLVYSNNSRATA